MAVWANEGKGSEGTGGGGDGKGWEEDVILDEKKM